jgi:hypothetical protein
MPGLLQPAWRSIPTLHRLRDAPSRRLLGLLRRLRHLRLRPAWRPKILKGSGPPSEGRRPTSTWRREDRPFDRSGFARNEEGIEDGVLGAPAMKFGIPPAIPSAGH